MKTHLAILVAATAVVLLAAGCGRKSPAQSAAQLEKAFQTPAPATAEATPVAPDAAPPPQGNEIQQAVSQAATAIRTNGYAEAFVTLRAIQAAPSLTLDQYSAIESARLAVERDVATKAAAGDPAALRALKAMKAAGH